MLKSKVRKYNTLAIHAPENVWTNRFAHPRMEVKGAVAALTFNHYVNKQTVPVIVSLDELAVDEEIIKLTKRIKERGSCSSM